MQQRVVGVYVNPNRQEKLKKMDFVWCNKKYKVEIFSILMKNTGPLSFLISANLFIYLFIGFEKLIIFFVE